MGLYSSMSLGSNSSYESSTSDTISYSAGKIETVLHMTSKSGSESINSEPSSSSSFRSLNRGRDNLSFAGLLLDSTILRLHSGSIALSLRLAILPFLDLWYLLH